jgi:site-specific DNA-cytosine methylase
MRYVNLFAGLGGAIKGLYGAADEVIWALEPDMDAAEVLSARFPLIPVRTENLASLHASDVPFSDATFVGAPTCAAASAPRLTLSLLSVTAPRVLIMDLRDRQFAAAVLPWLKEKEYSMSTWRDMALCLRKDIRVVTGAIPMPEETRMDGRIMMSVLEESPSPSLRLSAEKIAWLADREDRTRRKGFNFKSLVLSPESLVPILGTRFHKNPYSVLVDDGEGLRLLSPLECARIVGLGDLLVPACSRTKAYRLVTQSPDPEAVRLLAEELKVWV